MPSHLSYIAHVLLIVGSFVTASATQSSVCSICFCTGTEIFCQGKRLPAIPEDVPSTITRLNMKGNDFQVRTLFRSNFTRFTHLTQLTLAKCGLELIHADAFADLTSLIQLDLSSNRLLMIEDYTFSGLNLRRLFLHNNLGLFLSEQSFGNSSIEHLSMRHCGLYELKPAVLAPLANSLQDLLLDHNKLTVLDESVFSPGFPRLKTLSLGNNPWLCSCETRWLKVLKSQNKSMFIQEDLACSSPEAIRGQYFSALHLFDFGCQPPLFEDISVIFHADRAELSCNVGSEASTSVTWLSPSGTRNVYKSSLPDVGNSGLSSSAARWRVTKAKLVVPRPPFVSSPVESEFSGKQHTYRCIATNMMGNVSTSVNVVWPPPVRIRQSPSSQHDSSSNSSNLIMLGDNPAVCVDTMAIVGAIVGTFTVTLISVLIVLLATRKIRTCYRRRQSSHGFFRRGGHRDGSCWAPSQFAGKLVNGGSLRPGSASGNGAATPLVLNTSSGSSSSSRQSASGGNISGGNGTLNSHQFVYHPAHTLNGYHHQTTPGMLSQATNLEELSHFIESASSPSNTSAAGSGPHPMLSMPHPNSSNSGGFTYHAPPHKQMQVSLNSQYNRPTLR